MNELICYAENENGSRIYFPGQELRVDAELVSMKNFVVCKKTSLKITFWSTVLLVCIKNTHTTIAYSGVTEADNEKTGTGIIKDFLNIFIPVVEILIILHDQTITKTFSIQKQ